MSWIFSKKELLEEPEKYCNTINIKLLSIFIHKAISKYEEGEPLIPDTIYDICYDILKQRNPENIIFKKVGYLDVNAKNKVNIPYYMGSMDKIKEKYGIINWVKKYNGPYRVSAKLDGASALLENKNGILKLYSRGNGTIGKDISHLIKYINIPDISEDYCVRGELIISKDNFKKCSGFTTARSMVNGLINKKKTGDVKGLELVSFEFLKYRKETNMSVGEQFDIMEQLGFNTCLNKKYNINELLDFGKDNTIESSNILKVLLDFRLNYGYDIDGIIITDDKRYPKTQVNNPVYSFAFKSNGVGKITDVKKVEWNVSKHGYLIPRIQVDPINIDGNIINFTSGFNAKFIKDNFIGVGSKVRVVRSGDVIPYIIEIIQKSDTPDFPDKKYKWISSGVNIVEVGDTKELCYKKITNFFRTLNFDNISEGIIKRLVDNGYDSIKKILLITKDQLLEMDGIQQIMSTKLYNNIHKIIDNPIDLSNLMVASLVFGRGFGLKKIDKIVKKYPNILEINLTVDMINDIEGFSHKTSEQFIKNVSDFMLFLEELDFIKIKYPEKKNGVLFQDKKIVLTGFRDNDIIKFIDDNSGTITMTISKNTYMLIIKDSNSSSSKTQAAELLGIPIITKKQFISKYLD